MSKREKRLKKLRQNPTNISFDELRLALEAEGFLLDHATGSHHIFRCLIGEQVLRVVVPFARPVKSRYVVAALEAITQVIQTRRDLGLQENPDD